MIFIEGAYLTSTQSSIKALKDGIIALYLISF